MSDYKITEEVDCINVNCPMPLVLTRETIMSSKKGDIIKVIGTHPESYEEVPLTLKAMGHEILAKSKEGDQWEIIFEIK